MSHFMESLDRAVVETAKAVSAAHRGITIDKYKAYLRTMYHYTVNSRYRLERAADLCPGEELKDFFEQMAEEESAHYLLAEKDLESLGVFGSLGEKPQAVSDFESYWAHIESKEFGKFLGALYVLESVGIHLKSDAEINMSNLALSRNQARFVLVHLEEDIAHGKRTRELCEKYLESSAEDILSGAEESALHWKNIMCEGF